MMYKTINVKNSFEFVHCWPEAPKSLYYLRTPHRHVFKIETSIEINHNNRDLEFITVQHDIRRFLHTTHFKQRSSCEDIAECIVRHLIQLYGERDIAVTVSEDGENGATVYYEK